MISQDTSRYWLTFVGVFLIGIPSLFVYATGFEVPPLVAVSIFGVAILSAAFIMSWAAEVAEVDISASLAVAILVLLTVLPEYAIEAVLSWDAGAAFEAGSGVITDQTRRVAASATGATQLLFGLGWSVVILITWLKRRQVVDVSDNLGSEAIFLAIAVLPAFAIFFLGGINLVVAVVLIGIFVVYLWVSSTSEAEEPELDGIAAWLGSLPVGWRRTTVALLFAYAMVALLVATDPFVDGLVETGTQLGINDFVLIQFVAPLATETPEIVVALLFAMRGDPGTAIAVCMSSAIIKFTLLTGSLVVIFNLSAAQFLTFPLDTLQSTEFLLTASIATFGLVLLARGSLGWRAGLVLFGLFVARWIFTEAEERLWLAFVYLGLAAFVAVISWQHLMDLIPKQK